MSGWDESTESALLRGVDMPKEGYEVALVRIEQTEMDDRDNPGTMREVFIAHWRDSDGVKPYVMNKTARVFLKDQCGVSSANIGAFESIPLRLYQTPKKGAFAEGVGFMAREWRPEEVTATVATGNRPATLNPAGALPDEVPF